MSDMMNEGISLTFEPFAQEAQAEEPKVEEKKEEEKPKVPEIDDSMLSEEEKKMVEAFSQQIDITNSTQVMQYGAGAQQKVASFSEKALDNVRTKDLGQMGDLITDVVTELKGFDQEEEKGFFGRFKKGANKMATMRTRYEKAEKNIDAIVANLEKHQVTLMRDAASLDQLYALNLNYYKELTMYIIAGRKKLQKVENETIPALRAKAAQTGAQEDAQAVSDMLALADRFDKKIHDLELTRMVALQMGPQIRLVQNNDIVMSDKIQSTIVNTIPLWKSQMVIALGVAHSQDAAKAQREVTDLTNSMLKKNEPICCIIDEYGCFEGILSLEDVIETLIGDEIVDESDVASDMQEYARQRWAHRQRTGRQTGGRRPAQGWSA